MVLGGARNKVKTKPHGGSQAQTPKMAQVTSETAVITSERCAKPKQTLIQHNSSGDSDTEFTPIHTPSQENTSPQSILKQFEKMQHKALKQTSE